jgi:hypothetical protein
MSWNKWLSTAPDSNLLIIHECLSTPITSAVKTTLLNWITKRSLGHSVACTCSSIGLSWFVVNVIDLQNFAPLYSSLWAKGVYWVGTQRSH